MVEIETFGEKHEEFLRTYLELPNGIPSHDTIQRVFAMVSSEFLSGLQTLWNEMLNSGEGEKVRKILAIDGKTQRGNGNVKQKANHILRDAFINHVPIGFLTPATIDMLARSIEEQCEKERNTDDLKRINKLIRENETATANLIKALESGKAADIISSQIEKRQ